MKINKNFQMVRSLVIISLLALGFSLQAYSQVSKVPFTNRYQILLMEESDLTSHSRKHYQDFLKANKVLPASNKQAARVKRIGKHLAKSTKELLKANNMEDRTEELEFEFNLVESDEVNAWCMPGGKIVVYTGILPYCESDGLLASLLAHEIAHAVAYHRNERISQALALEGVGNILKGELNDYIKNYESIFDLAFGVSSELGLLAYSRTHEYEADILGMYIIAYAGYKPSYAKKFWENMMRGRKSAGFEFLSTHPTSEKRMEHITEKIPEAEAYYRKQ